jgi:FkbM family methyltransferase
MSTNYSPLDFTISAFERGDIDKPTFIRQMYESHHAALFDYANFLARTNVKRIEIEDGRVVMVSRDRGVRIECAQGDFRIAPLETLNFQDYEKQDAQMMEELLLDGQTFFDIGANIGWYSINLALSRRTASFHAFEPLPLTFAQLKRNVALNAVRNVEIHNFGFSESSATLEFFYYPEGSGNASARNLTQRTDVQKVACEVRKLDDHVRATRQRVDFIKCDVEGAELLVFKGAVDTISRDRPVIFSEILRKWSAKFDYDPNEIFTLLRSLGYAAFTSDGRHLKPFGTMTNDTTDTNFFFLHTEKHAEQIARLAIQRL